MIFILLRIIIDDVIKFGVVKCENWLIIVAEVVGKREGIREAVKFGLRKVIIEGDIINVINGLRTYWSVLWKIAIIIKDARVDISFFKKFKCWYCFKEVNQAVGFMVRFVYLCSLFLFWTDCFDF